MAYRATLNGEVFFNTNSISQALGLLSASLDLKAGSAGLFSFTVPHVNKYYDHFHLLSDYIDVYRDDEVIFNGRVSSISMNFDLTMNIEAEGLLAVLNDSIFRPTTHEGTLGQLVDKLLQSHNQQVEGSKLVYVGTIANPTRNAYRQYENYESTFSRISDLVDSFGGYPTIRKTNGVLYLDWPSSITTVGAQSVDFGENEISINEDANTDDYITVLIPLGAQIEDEDTGERTRLTIESVNSGNDYIELAEATNKVVGVYTWDDITVASNLLTAGQAYLNAQSVLKTTIEVTAVDLADTGLNIDNFKIGTLIRVTSKPHGLDNQSFECIEQKLNLLDPADNKLTLGGTLEGFTIKAQKEALFNTKVIERVEANYVTNQRVNDIKTDLEQNIRENTTLIEQNSEQISLLATQTETLAQNQNIINLLPSVYYSENKSSNPWTNNGITWTRNSDGSVTATGTATKWSKYKFTGASIIDDIPPITIESDKHYTLSGCPNGGGSSTYLLTGRWTSKGFFPSSIKGKKISIIGDSIDTFDAEGYKIDGYLMYYPAADVTSVDQTWWKKVIDSTGAILEVNASWSGSGATHIYSGSTPDFYDRVGLIGNPDIVFVTLGTNDSGLNVPLGDYDFETAYTDLSESTFRTAYIKGIKALKATHSNIQIVCIAEKMGDQYKESIATIADELGAIFIDASDYIGQIGVHPGVEGMEQIADLVLYPSESETSDFGSGYTSEVGNSYVSLYATIFEGYTCPEGGLTFHPMLEVGETVHGYVSPMNGIGSLTQRMQSAELKITPNAITTTVMQNTNYTQSQNNINLLPSVYGRENLSGATWIDSRGITWTVNTDGSITASGTATSSSWYLVNGCTLTDNVPPVTLDPDKRYTISGCPSGGGSGTYYILGEFFKANETPSDSLTHPKYDYGSGCTSDDAYKWVNIWICIVGGQTVSNLKFYPMLEVGSVKHGYSSSHNGTSALTSRIASAESSITQNATNIALKVSTTDYNGSTIASLINQSASTVTINAAHINLTGSDIVGRINDSSVTINAARINLNGAVTANNYFKINPNGSMEAIAGKIANWTINGDMLECTTSNTSGTQYQTYAQGVSNINNVTTWGAFGVRHRASSTSAWVNDFYVLANGKLYANNAEITGTITSSSATITGGTINIDTSSASAQSICISSTANNKTVFMTPNVVWVDDGTYHFTALLHWWGFEMSTYYTSGGATSHHGYFGGYSPGDNNVQAANVGKIYVDTNYVIYYDSCTKASDKRLKTNIKTLTYDRAKKIILNSRPVTYEKVESPTLVHHGLVAQEVEKLELEKNWQLVLTDKNGYRSIDYIELIPDLIAMVQGLYQEVQDLKAQIV